MSVCLCDECVSVCILGIYVCDGCVCVRESTVMSSSVMLHKMKHYQNLTIIPLIYFFSYEAMLSICRCGLCLPAYPASGVHYL